MLMLSYADADKLFGKLKRVIIDETHSLMENKRGDFLSLALARLSVFSPHCKRIGLSATVAFPETLGAWLAGSDSVANIIKVKAGRSQKLRCCIPNHACPLADLWHAMLSTISTKLLKMPKPH